MTVTAWVVVLEAADTGATGGINYEAVQRLLSELSAHHPSGLYAPDRYAVQLVLRTARPAEALNAAQTLWEGAVTACGLPEWDLVRAEVKTLAELHAELAAEAAMAACEWRPAEATEGPRRLTSLGGGREAETTGANRSARCRPNA